MVASDAFAEFLREQLAPLGRVTLRRMFGKSGVFCDGVMFAMVTENTLYFRVDDANRPVTVGTWDQIRDDVLKMQQAGVTEAFFDVAFQPDAQTQRGLMQYLERFRTILESPVPA